MPVNTPFFSIVTPVYKGLHFLEHCTKSVLAQSCGDFEYVLVDDGSPDASGALCDALALADERIRVLHQKNGGITNARNAGIRAAKGQYLLFLDQDDRLSPWLLETIKTHIDAGTHDVITWRHHTVLSEMAEGPGGKALHLTPAQMGALYNSGTFHYVWTKVFQLDFLQRNQLYFDESIRDGTDDLPFVNAYYHAWFSAYPNACVHFFDQRFYYYNTDNDASVSKRLQPYLPSHLTMYANLMQDMKTLYGAPADTLCALYNQCLTTLSYGVYSTEKSARKSLNQRLLRDPQMIGILNTMQQHKLYSGFYAAFRLGNSRLIAFLFKSHLGRRWWYLKFYQLAYFLVARGWQHP